MEYVPGGDMLQDIMRQGRFLEAHAQRLLAERLGVDIQTPAIVISAIEDWLWLILVWISHTTLHVVSMECNI